MSVLDGHRDAFSDARFAPGGRTSPPPRGTGPRRSGAASGGAPHARAARASPLDSVDFAPDGPGGSPCRARWLALDARRRAVRQPRPSAGGSRPSARTRSCWRRPPGRAQLHDGRDGRRSGRGASAHATTGRRRYSPRPSAPTEASWRRPARSPARTCGACAVAEARSTCSRASGSTSSPSAPAAASWPPRAIRPGSCGSGTVRHAPQLRAGRYPDRRAGLEFSPDGRLIASVSAGQRVRARSEPRQRAPRGRAAPRERGAGGELRPGRAARAVGGQRRPRPPVGRPLGPPDRRPRRPRRHPGRGPLQPRRPLDRHGERRRHGRGAPLRRVPALRAARGAGPPASAAQAEQLRAGGHERRRVDAVRPHPHQWLGGRPSA